MRLNRPVMRLGLAFGLALGGLTLALYCLPRFFNPTPVQAQGPTPIELRKTLNRDSNVVRVGELLSFTIRLTNASNFNLSNVALLDNYAIGILAFAYAIPPQDEHNPASGHLTWTNVAQPEIPPGGIFTATVVFTAVAPSPAVVNYARARDLVFGSSALTQTYETSETQEAVGGRTIVGKNMVVTGQTLAPGIRVTFTHRITNDGAATLVFQPFTDTYEASFLHFEGAIPPPSIYTPGYLHWADVTADLGDIPPFGVAVITTFFTIQVPPNITGSGSLFYTGTMGSGSFVVQVITTTNNASSGGGRDQYGNDIAGGEANVPIQIIDSSINITPEPTPFNTATPQTTATPSPIPTATPNPTETPAPTVTPTRPRADTPTPLIATPTTTTINVTASPTPHQPYYLPETGHLDSPPRNQSPTFGWLWLISVLLLTTWLWKTGR